MPHLMRRSLFGLLAGASVLVVMVSVNALPVPAQGASATTTGTTPSNSISVSATGTVQVAPDMATVSLGVQVTNYSATAAQAQVNKVAAAAVKALHKLGITDHEIQTTNLSLNPQYDQNSTFTGYQASETLQVTVYALALAGPVIDAGVAAGANTNLGIQFGLRDPNAAQLDALKLAVQQARAHAQVIAQELGVDALLAHARVQISESGAQPSNINQVPMAAFSRVAAAAAPAQVLGGTLSVQETVNLTYVF